MARFALIDTTDQPAIDVLRVWGTFVDDKDGIKFPFQVDLRGVLTPELIRSQLARAFDAGQSQATAKVTIKPGEQIDLAPPVVLPPDPPPPPDPALVAERAFLTAWKGLENALRKVTDGLLDAADPSIVTLRADVVKLYLPEYLTLGLG